MKRRHSMPFGADVAADGRVRFQLWAPSAQRVEVVLEREVLPLTASDNDGWFALATDRAAHGSLYRFRIDGADDVSDPASRYNPQDVHGPSCVWDPHRFDWRDQDWHGRPWEEAVIYELHVGAFTASGTFTGAIERLDYLKRLGVTAIELMPVADFPGRHNWGYDGVLPFAPDSVYGTPNDFKQLVQEAHARGLMVLLDVVYNHFGPDGNYLSRYAKAFFTERHQTPWGAGINFDGPHSRVVRDFFIHNALYWLEEFHLDGLRFDAVHAIADDSQPDIVEELALRVRTYFSATRPIHLVLENDRNTARYLGRDGHTAQWNDDAHHAMHVLLTGERDSYYADYADQPVRYLGRCLTQGFAYQGQHSPFRGAPRGEPSAALPPTAFVDFLQNHDQIGNRAFGERIFALASARAVQTVMTILLLAPHPPLLFMGDEFAAASPFLFFCDHQGELAQTVRDGRRQEFAHFPAFADPALRARIPDPNAPETFLRSKLNWDWPARSAGWFDFVQRLLMLRQGEIAPRLAGIGGNAGEFAVVDDTLLSAVWSLGDGSRLRLLAQLHAQSVDNVETPPGRLITCSHDDVMPALQRRVVPGWSCAWFLENAA